MLAPMFEREESDQLPEEGPSEQVPDDEGGSRSARKDAQENPGAADEGEDGDKGQATGNPANAG
jgi:hypothetical protein